MKAPRIGSPDGGAHRLAGRLDETERRFGELWQRLDRSDTRSSVYRACNPLRLAGDVALAVRFQNGDWLEILLDEQAAASGVRWVTYHVASITDHEECVVSPSRAPALWRAAGHYLGMAMEAVTTQPRGRDR